MNSPKESIDVNEWMSIKGRENMQVKQCQVICYHMNGNYSWLKWQEWRNMMVDLPLI